MATISDKRRAAHSASHPCNIDIPSDSHLRPRQRGRSASADREKILKHGLPSPLAHLTSIGS